MKFLVQNNQKQGKTSKQILNNTEKKSDPQYFFYNIMNPSNKIQCDQCKRDITKSTKILANQCDYCVGCFSNLQEVPAVYHVVNKMDFPLFESDWTAEEELLLFEGLEKHGFGNWSQIADFIGTNKSREEVQDHYAHVFLDAQSFVPAKRQVLTKRENGKLVIKQDLNKTQRKRNPKQNPKQTIASNHQFQRGSLTVHNISAANKTGTNPAQIVGFMPKRGDFQVEYDNDAELLLAQMEFNDDDSEDEKQMKFRLMDIYNHKLNQRIKRKEFVITRKLLDLKEQMRCDKMRTKEEKEIYNMMKVFARFNTPQDHQKLVNGIIKQKQIRQRIQQLKEYKKKGFRTLGDIEEELQNKRKKQQKNKKKSQTDLYGGGFGQKGNTRRSRKDVPVQKNQKRTTYLTKEEEELCNKFNITFKQYMLIKETLVRQSVKQGIIQKDQSGKIFKIDRGISDGIFDFLVQKNEILGK